MIGLLPDKSGLKSTVSNEVLYLKLSGPKDHHLSSIDISCIFKRTTSGVTTKADMEMVEGIVYNYMKTPCYVMLVVVLANVYIATHKILEKAEDVDREGTRTLGILTKADIVDKGVEKNMIYLVEGRIFSSNWVGMSFAMLVKQNFRSPGFFDQKAPWNGFAKDKVGIKSFQSRLQEIFADDTGREIPQVRSPAHLSNDTYQTGENCNYQKIECVPVKLSGSRPEASDMNRTKQVFDGNRHGISKVFRRSIVVHTDASIFLTRIRCFGLQTLWSTAAMRCPTLSQRNDIPFFSRPGRPKRIPKRNPAALTIPTSLILVSLL